MIEEPGAPPAAHFGAEPRVGILPEHIEVSTDIVIGLEPGGRITSWSRGAEQALGWSRQAVLGESVLARLVSPRHRELFERVLATAAAGRGHETHGRPAEIAARHRDGHEMTLEIDLSPLVLEGGGAGLAAFCRDVSARREAEQLLAMHDAVNAALAADGPQEALAGSVMEAVCGALAWPAGVVWVVDESGRRLRALGAWFAPWLSGPSADELIGIVECGAGDGLPWDAWSSAEPIWIPQLHPRSTPARERAAYRAGLRSSGCVPIRNGQHVLGVLEFFSNAPGTPSAARFAQVETVGLRLGRSLRNPQPTGPKKSRFKLDTRNTHLEFSCAFMKFMTVHGTFRDFSGWVEVDGDDVRTARGECTIKTASIDTRSVERDYHLCSDDFFAVERFPDMTYRTARIEPLGDERFRILGDLTIRDVSRPIRLEVRLEDIETDASGTVRVMLTGWTVINRLEWFLDWEKALQAGRWIVGNEVRLDLVIALVRRAEAWEVAR